MRLACSGLRAAYSGPGVADSGGDRNPVRARGDDCCRFRLMGPADDTPQRLTSSIAMNDEREQLSLSTRRSRNRAAGSSRRISTGGGIAPFRYASSTARADMLLQRRALEKYHSGGLWTNACCTHPRPGERPDLAARRRLMEEIGIVCPLKFVTRIPYRAPVGDGLIEDEIVHLFVGDYDGAISADTKEVSELRGGPTRICPPTSSLNRTLTRIGFVIT